MQCKHVLMTLFLLICLVTTFAGLFIGGLAFNLNATPDPDADITSVLDDEGNWIKIENASELTPGEIREEAYYGTGKNYIGGLSIGQMPPSQVAAHNNSIVFDPSMCLAGVSTSVVGGFGVGFIGMLYKSDKNTSTFIKMVCFASLCILIFSALMVGDSTNFIMKNFAGPKGLGHLAIFKVLMPIVLGISGIGFCFSATYVVCDALHDQCFPVTTISEAKKRWGGGTTDASNSENEDTSNEILILEPSESRTTSNGMAHDETDLQIGSPEIDSANSLRLPALIKERRRLGTGNISPVLIELAEATRR